MMEGRIEINGQIGRFSGTDGVELVDVIAQVRKQPEATSFRVYINSEGGLVSVGFDIFNYLKSLGLPITTVGNGLVASVATVIFMAGTKRVIREGTLFMIHLPMGSIQGTADEIAKYAKAVKTVETKMLNFYVQEFGIQKEAIEPLLTAETWLTAEQLEDLGITTSSPIGVAAKANLIIEEQIDVDKKSNPNKHKMKNKDNEKTILQKVIALVTAAEAGEGATGKKMLYDSNSKALQFPNVEEDAVIAIGDMATYDDKPAEGDILLQDGRKLKFTNGKLESITEAPEPNDEEIARLQTELDAKTAEVDAKAAEVVAIRAELDAEKAKVAAKDAILESIKALGMNLDVEDKKDKTDARGGKDGKKESRFAAAIANIKNTK